MRVQIYFYLKQTRWRLVIGFLVTFIFSVFAPQWAQPNMPVPELLTEKRELKLYEPLLDYVIKDYKDGGSDVVSKSVPADIRMVTRRKTIRLKSALFDGNYPEANKLTLQILQGSNQDINKDLLVPFGYRTPGTDVPIVYEYLLKHHINSSPAATQRSDAFNAVALLMGAWGSHQDTDGSVMEPGVAFYLTLACLCLVFGSLFSHTTSSDTESFERNLPVSEIRRQFERALIQLLIIDLLLVLVIVASICFVAILPGHNIGDPRYPLVVIVKGNTVLVPVWQYYGRWLLLVNLWGLFLAGISELVLNFQVKCNDDNEFLIVV